jgi:hypothetical protein
MDANDRNVLRLSGRLRALEQLMTTLLIDWADRTGPDPLEQIDAARKYAALTVQTQERPVNEAADIEAGALSDTLNEIFADARAEIEAARTK